MAQCSRGQDLGAHLMLLWLSPDELAALLASKSLSTQLSQLEEKLMSALSDLQAAVAREDTVVDSAITLLQGLKSQLDAAIASGSEADLITLSEDIGARTQALADAVAANTPAAPGA